MYLDDTQITEGKALVRKIYESSADKEKLSLIAGTSLGNLAMYYSKTKTTKKLCPYIVKPLFFYPIITRHTFETRPTILQTQSRQ